MRKTLATLAVMAASAAALGATAGPASADDPNVTYSNGGNAQNWTAGALAAGRTVSKTPSQGALMVLQAGVMGAGASTGHVGYVESVQRDSSGTPTSFVVSEQNWNGVRTPTTRPIQVSGLPAGGVDFIG